jgi:hypothetical protein
MKTENARYHALGFGIVILLTFGPTAVHAAPNDNSAVGINLAGVTYWSSEIVFVDLFQHSQTFKSQGDPQTQNEVAQMTVDQVLDKCAEYIGENNKTIAKQAQAAKQRGLR